MTQPGRAERCDRARERISLALDDELSQLDGVWLRGHLARCPACRSFQHDARTFTATLRGEPLDRPYSLSDWRVPSRPSLWHAPMRGRMGVLATATVMLGAITLAGPLRTGFERGTQAADIATSESRLLESGLLVNREAGFARNGQAQVDAYALRPVGLLRVQVHDASARSAGVYAGR